MCPQVNYFNEIHAVWEPLIERVDSGRRRWNVELEVNQCQTSLRTITVGRVCLSDHRVSEQ